MKFILRTKCVNQKLLKLIQVNVPFFFRLNLKNEGARAQKSLFWLIDRSINEKNVFISGPSSCLRFRQNKIIWNSNLNYFKQLLFHTFCPQIIFYPYYMNSFR